VSNMTSVPRAPGMLPIIISCTFSKWHRYGPDRV